MPRHRGPATVTAATELRIAPDGRVLAQLRAGGGAQILASKNGWSQVAVEGWLHVSVLGPKRDSFALSVKSPNGALMRAAAERTAPVVAQLAGRDGSRAGAAHRSVGARAPHRMGAVEDR